MKGYGGNDPQNTKHFLIIVVFLHRKIYIFWQAIYVQELHYKGKKYMADGSSMSVSATTTDLMHPWRSVIRALLMF